ncbi:hypothetical protein SK128_019266 [Halocaridina rubra]|uniref:SH3 domain-containing protein n=1 Tax=Halocaridina rubra TaxID=373956 RepID=A0AAN8XFN9_HALRR
MEDLLTGDIRPVRRAPPPPQLQPRNDYVIVIQPDIENSHQPAGRSMSKFIPQRAHQNGLPRSASLPLTNGSGSQKKKAPPPRPPPPKSKPAMKSFHHQELNGSSHRNSMGGLVGKLRGPPPARPRAANIHSSSAPCTPATEASLIDFSSPPGSPTTRSGSDGLSVNSFGSESSSGNQSSGFDDSFDPFGSILDNACLSGTKEVGGSSFFMGASSNLSAARGTSTKEVGVSSFFTGNYASQPSHLTSNLEASQDPFEVLARRTELSAKQAKPPDFNAAELSKSQENPVTLPHPSAQPVALAAINNKSKPKPSFKPTIIRTKAPVTSSQIESAGGSAVTSSKDDLLGISWGAASKSTSTSFSSSGWSDSGVSNIIDQTIPEEPPPPLPPRPESENNDQDRPYSVAEYDFTSSQQGDLDFKTGEVIQLLYRVNEEWLFGRCGLKEGMFPENFVKIVVPLAGESIAPSSSCSTSTTQVSSTISSTQPSWDAAPSSQVPKIVTVLYTFQAETAEDLTIYENSQVKVLGRLNDEWLYGDCNGKQGQFPANFVDRVPPGLPQM